MSITSLIGSDGKLRRIQYSKPTRATVRQQLALRQEQELLANDEWNDAFKTFVHDRDNDLADDAISIASVL